jgi:hypothetical protein
MTPVFTRGRRRERTLASRLVVDIALLALALIALATPVSADARLCLGAADVAADRHGVPRAVMRALTRTETGRTRERALQPWPWTVNMEGAGYWFDTRAEALAFAEAEQARGARSFDIGCFQVNHRWHGQHFPSVDAMFDPVTNADYAARFLRELFEETGTWDRAAGFYHSRTPEHFERYAARFARILARGDADTPGVDVAAAPAPVAPDPERRALARARIAAVLVALPLTPGAVELRFAQAHAPIARATRRLID